MTAADLAGRLVRAWASAYTRGLPDAHRDRRQLELDSDLWEHAHDTAERAIGVAIIGRLLRGIPADVRWRYRTLLDARGAQQRSQDMSTSSSDRWWEHCVRIVAVLSVTAAAFAVVLGAPTGMGILFPVISASAGAALLAGIALRRKQPVRGSQIVIAGSVLLALSDLVAVPIALVIVVAGLWTGSLRTDESKPSPVFLTSRQRAMTDHWYVWLVAAAFLAGLGFVVLLIWPAVTPDNCTELNPCWEDTAAWATWILSWLGAIVVGGIGLLLGTLRLRVRHRTQLA